MDGLGTMMKMTVDLAIVKYQYLDFVGIVGLCVRSGLDLDITLDFRS